MANFLITSRSRRAMKSKNTHDEKRSDSSSDHSDKNFSCKKHTKHRQSPGICSLCLTEKLSKVSLEYYDYTKNLVKTTSYCSSRSSSSSSYVSSCYSSSSISSCSSPLQYGYREKKKKDAKKQGFLLRLLLGSIVD